MSHDKIKAVARKRMAETGEPYATARREVIKNYQEAGPRSRLALRREMVRYRLHRYGPGLPVDGHPDGQGPGTRGRRGRPGVLRVRNADFHLDIPRGSVRSVTRPEHQHRGTTGIHARRGSWLVTRSHDGLVELAIEPPCYLPRQLSTVFREMKANSLIISVADPDGFIAAVDGDGPGGD